MAAATRAAIDDFLAQKRLAVVGVSRTEKDFTRGLFRELHNQGYEVIPVNPEAVEIEGQPCFKRVQDITPPVDGALLFTPPQITAEVVKDCAEAGIGRVWMHRGEGLGAVNQAAVEFCRQNNISVVPGFCPYMFLPKSAFFHKLHGFAMKLGGKYPS